MLLSDLPLWIVALALVVVAGVVAIVVYAVGRWRATAAAAETTPYTAVGQSAAPADAYTPIEQPPAEDDAAVPDHAWATLVRVSADVAHAGSLAEAIPVILNGILHVSNADGARTIIFNPRGGSPLLHGTGPLATEMAPLDRAVLALRRHESEVLLDSAESIRDTLSLSETEDLPISSLLSVPLHGGGRLLGIVWLGGTLPLAHTKAQAAVIESLTNQAAVLVANARLYAQAEQGLQRLTAMLNSTEEPVAVIDQSNRFSLINPAMSKAFDLDADEVRNRQVSDVVLNDTLRTVLLDPVDAANGRELADGDDRVFTAGVSQINIGDDLAGRIVVLHDITRLKELDALKSEFVSNVSHDLRNPLVYMHAYVNMLDQVGDLNEKQTEFVGHISKGVDRMHSLITALLDLSRIESEQGLELGEIDVADLLQETVDTHTATAALSHNTFAVKLAEPAPHFQGDVWLVRMALDNLISNALKFAPETGVITLSGKQVNGEVVIGVSDQGPGIDPEDVKNLFNKFYRAAHRGTPQVSGSGLGLAIVKSAVEKHGGRAWCESEPDQGSTFYVAFPQHVTTA